jgi:hypothetical protein
MSKIISLGDGDVIPTVRGRPARIAVAMATHDYVPARFAIDLAQMMMVTARYVPEDVELGVNMVLGTYVHSARQELLEALIDQEVTHVLWVDTDMTFPPDALIRLMEHRAPVVGINYSKRGLPPEYVAIKRVGIPGEKLVTDENTAGLEEVEALGFGMVLMRADALRKLPPREDGPWFNFDWLPGTRQWVGEDVHFCGLLREAGVTILVDHDLSKECGHIGTFDYRLEGVKAWREA